MGSKLSELKKSFNGSVMTYIKGSMIGIISLAICTLFASYWITERADLDARAINLSGSLRMEAFQLGMYALEGNQSALEDKIVSFETKLSDPIFSALQKNPDLTTAWQVLVDHWQLQLKPVVRSLPIQDADFLHQKVAGLAGKADLFVLAVQENAEWKIKLLRMIQLTALAITLFVGIFTLNILNRRVERPLVKLTNAAYAISEGDFTQHLNLKGSDELALLGATLNHTCEAISSMYGQLERRVKEQTQELEVNNNALAFLFKMDRQLLEAHKQELDYQTIFSELAQLIEVENIELCVMTSSGDKPYLQVKACGDGSQLCEAKYCESCDGNAVFVPVDRRRVTRYPLIYDTSHYGVIVVTGGDNMYNNGWQHQLVQSVADQVALALNLSDQQNQERRIALLHERTAIARELHDSLAQALSYLKIQVTRLSKTQQKEQFEQQPPIIDELKTGLDAAYRQLRELLTTFRLKMVENGLEAALENTIEQLAEQSDIHFHLNFAIKQVPLSPLEEIHLLQITREACQNTVHHSQAENVWVEFSQLQDHRIRLSVRDDGVGIGHNSAKLNHYGMAIMQERARHLHGELDVAAAESGGTQVLLIFTPIS